MDAPCPLSAEIQKWFDQNQSAAPTKPIVGIERPVKRALALRQVDLLGRNTEPRACPTWPQVHDYAEPEARRMPPAGVLILIGRLGSGFLASRRISRWAC